MEDEAEYKAFLKRVERDLNTPAERIEVELHSTEPSAVEATRATLAQAPLNSALEEADGKFYVVTDNPGFLRFALERQGYVKRIVK